MKKIDWNRAKAESGWIVAAIVSLTLVGTVLAVNPTFSGGPVSNGSFVVGPSYIVFTDGSNFFARNGKTGAVDTSGSNPTTVIQYALDQTSSSGGGAVQIKAGNYSLPSLITLRSNEVLQGEGSEATLLYLQDTITTLGVQIYTVKNVTVKDLKIVRSPTSPATAYGVLQVYNNAYNVVVDNVHVDALNKGSGLVLSWGGNRNIVFQNSYITNASTDGIQILGAVNGMRISGNMIYNTGKSGIVVNGGSYGPDTNMTIANNIIRKFAVTTTGTAAIFMTPSNAATYTDHVSIMGNVITAASGVSASSAGIYTTYAAVSTRANSNLVVSSNVVYGVRGLADCFISEGPNGYYFGTDILYANNLGTGCDVGLTAILIDDVTVSGNIINGTGYEGMAIDTKHSFVTGNVITNSGQVGAGGGGQAGILGGFHLHAGVFTNNVIGNTYAYTSQLYGVYEQGAATGDIIEYNDLRNNANAGITNLGSNTIARYNLGYVTENGGNTSAGGGTSFTFAHGLASSPLFVSASFNVATCGAWGWTTTATQITITTASACTGYITWYARTWLG